ncbi:hypothetical protein ES703_41010 [subsurface metagenome]
MVTSSLVKHGHVQKHQPLKARIAIHPGQGKRLTPRHVGCLVVVHVGKDATQGNGAVV